MKLGMSHFGPSRLAASLTGIATWLDLQLTPTSRD
jgi:hypothetical protein